MWIIYLFIFIYNVASTVPNEPFPNLSDDDDLLNPNTTCTKLCIDDYWVPLDMGVPMFNCTTAPCLSCTEMPQQPCGDSPLWRSMNFGILPNSSYRETFMLGNDNCSDSVNFTDSVFLVVETSGFWVIDTNDTWPEGWDSDDEMEIDLGTIVSGEDVEDSMEKDPEILDFESEWYHVYFLPMMFNVTIFDDMDFYYSNVTDFYYRNMTDLYLNNMTEGVCMPILDYWNNETIGCPCNDTWDTTGYYNSSTNSFMGGRQIIPNECNDTCGEMMFLNDTMKYANVRINVTECKNGTVLKTLEFTSTNYDKDIAYTYGAENITYVFGAWAQKAPENAIVIVTNSSDHGDDYYDANGSNGLPMSTMITMMFIFLLRLIYPN